MVVYVLNHYVIKPHTEEKKAKLSKHYDKMIGILKDWYGIKFELKNKDNDFPKISIPLYIDVIDQIQELDNVQHIELHFKDKRYHTINALYQKLKLAQNDHNEQVRKNLPIFEKKLLELMSGRIHLQHDQIKEAVLGKIFQYYSRVSSGNNIHLIPKVYKEESGLYVRDIVPSDDDDTYFLCT